MDFIKAYEILKDARYHDNSDTSRSMESSSIPLIRSVYNDNCLGCLKANLMDICGEYERDITERDTKIATLEAKVYAYEKIIGNSNFKPIVEGSVVLSELPVKPYIEAKTQLLARQKES